MKSRITIEVDFENGNEPSIQIISKDSDDVRDKLIKAFYQKLGGSSWCSIRFDSEYFEIGNPENDFKKIIIKPIPDSELKNQAEVMLEQARVNEEYNRK